MTRTTLLSAGLCLLAVSCGGEANQSAASATDADATTISWLAQSPGAGQVVVQTMRISTAQRQWLMAARVRARARLSAGLAPVVEAPPVEAMQPAGEQAVSSALVAGSANWSDCQSLEWFYMTSGANNTGSIFCAHYTPINGSDVPISIGGAANPFVPQYVDPAYQSDAWFNICTSSSNCVLNQCCQPGGACSGIWRSYGRRSAGGNISPPASATRVFAQPGIYPC